MDVASTGYSYRVLQGKKHPADWANPGRVKVQLKNGQFFSNPKYTSRKCMMCCMMEDYQAKLNGVIYRQTVNPCHR